MFNVATDSITAKPYILHLNEFVANVLHDNNGSEKISLHPQRKKKGLCFSLKFTLKSAAC